MSPSSDRSLSAFDTLERVVRRWSAKSSILVIRVFSPAGWSEFVRKKSLMLSFVSLLCGLSSNLALYCAFWLRMFSRFILKTVKSRNRSSTSFLLNVTRLAFEMAVNFRV